MNNNLLGVYKNGNYFVTIFSDGTKIRRTNEDDFVPAFSENCDVKITDKCDGGCPFCYEGCTANGNHAKLMNDDGTPYWNFLNTLHPYTELALNGNDLTHPELMSFLSFLKSKKVIANLTVNQMHFNRERTLIQSLIDNKLINGLGISLNDATDTEVLKFANSNPNVVLHTIAGILTKLDLDYLEDYPNLKILILGYKNIGRGESYKTNHDTAIHNGILWLKSELPSIIKKFNVISFDNLAIEQLDVKHVLFDGREDDWSTFYMGDDGTFTFYMDLVKGEYSKNSCMPYNERFKIGNMTVDEMFNDIRHKY